MTEPEATTEDGQAGAGVNPRDPRAPGETDRVDAVAPGETEDEHDQEMRNFVHALFGNRSNPTSERRTALDTEEKS